MKFIRSILFCYTLFYGILSAASSSQSIDDLEAKRSNWVLDPSPNIQRHRVAIVPSSAPQGGKKCIMYETGNQGKYGYFQIINRSFKNKSKDWKGATEITFQLKGDGTDSKLQMTIFENDGTRWYHLISLQDKDWKTIRIPLNKFKIEVHGSQKRAETSNKLQIDEISNISFVLKKGFPHRIFIDNIALEWGSKTLTEKDKGISAEIYPATTHRNNKVTFIRGEVLPASIFCWNKKVTGQATLKLQIPSDDVGITGCFISTEFQGWSYKGTIFSRATNQGKIWSVALPDRVICRNQLSKFQPALTILFDTNRNAELSEFEIPWQITVNSQTLNSGVLHAVIVPELKPLSSKSLLPFFAYTTSYLNSPDVNLREKLFQLYSRAGIQGGVIYSENSAVPNWLIHKGWIMLKQWNWWGNWGVTANEFSEKTSDILATMKNGKKSQSPKVICPSFLLDHAKPNDKYFELIKRKLNSMIIPGMAGFINDHEMEWTRDISPVNSCFCPQCIQAFARYANIKDDRLTAAKILKDYKHIWFDFRYRQQADLIKTFAHAVKAIDDKLTPVICSYPVLPSRDICPIDIRLYDNFNGLVHWAQCYKTGTVLFDEVKRTVEQLNSQLVILLNTCDPIGEPVYVSPDQFKLNLISTVTSGAKGVAFFTGLRSLDGEYLQIINNVAATLSKLNEITLRGKRIDNGFVIRGIPDKVENIEIMGKKVISHYPDWKRWLRHRLFVYNGKTLLCLYNYSQTNHCLTKIISRSMKSQVYIYDPVENELYSPGNNKEYWNVQELRRGLKVVIPPNSARFLIISDSLGSDLQRLLEPQDVKRQYLKMKLTAAKLKTKKRDSLVVKTVGRAPVIDGKLDDECWRRAGFSRRSFVSPPKNKPAKEQTKFSICSKGNSLYIAFDCDGRRFHATQRQRDGQLWLDDCIEVFLAPGGNDYYHFIVNAIGTKFDACKQNVSWNSEQWRSAVHVDSKAGKWYVEMEIPLSVFPVSGPINVNFCRENLSAKEISSYFPTGSSFHKVEAFGALKFLSN